MKNKIFEIYNQNFRPSSFALWAMPKKTDLSIPRKRYLSNTEEVVWNIGEEEGDCADHIEMSGFYASAIISYGKDYYGRLKMMKHLVIPTLRVQPNVTQSSFSYNFKNSPDEINVDGKRITEHPREITIKGNLKIHSSTDADVYVTREFLPAVNKPALIEIVTIINNSTKHCNIALRSKPTEKRLNSFFCVGGKIIAKSASVFGDCFKNSGNVKKSIKLNVGSSVKFYNVYYAFQDKDLSEFSITDEIEARRSFIDEMFTSLRLETPVRELNAQFTHCILRGSESIFKTKNGLMHAPGGGNYYAALWTNDQCEYANPFFPFLGYDKGIEQCINCYSLYENYMDKSDKPMKDKQALVSSIVAEGTDYWNGAGDRGDGEMYAYGITRFLLEMSDRELINRFWSSVVWCLDFALSRKMDDGVIASDSDELENRFESGNANLFTSCITYDALCNGVILADIVGDNFHKEQWNREQRALRTAIEKYFGDNVEGFDTYRYYDGNVNLRSWICMPLTVEILTGQRIQLRLCFLLNFIMMV